ncbi:hypothetical protein ACFL58_04825, partial [Elusimicrobiota bacterium]
MVINIQDLHCHAEVQKNIGRILQILDEKYKLQNIYLEGASGQVDTSWLGSIKDKPIQRQITDALVEKGRLTGTEYYSIISGRSKVILGIEDQPLYEANFKRLSKIIENQRSIDDVLTNMGFDIRYLKNTYYNKRQKKLEKIVSRYKSGDIDAKKYYRLISRYADKLGVDIYGYRNVSSYIALMGKEREINYQRVARQLQQFVAVLKQRLPYGAYKYLIEKTDNFTKIDNLYSYLIKVSKEYNLNLSRSFPDLSKFFDYITASKSINPLILVKEEKRLISELQYRLSDNVAEKEVGFAVNFFKYFEDYFGNKISAEDLEYFNANIDDFRFMWAKYINNYKLSLLDPYFDLLSEYYSANIKRNEAFVENIIGKSIYEPKSTSTNPYVDDADRVVQSLNDSKEVKVVVTGGFHTEGITQILEKRNISYIVITPNVTQDTALALKTYEKLAKEQAKIMFQAFQLPILSTLSEQQKIEIVSAVLDLVKRNITPEDAIQKVLNEKVFEGTGVEVEVSKIEGNYKFEFQEKGKMIEQALFTAEGEKIEIVSNPYIKQDLKTGKRTLTVYSDFEETITLPYDKQELTLDKVIERSIEDPAEKEKFSQEFIRIRKFPKEVQEKKYRELYRLFAKYLKPQHFQEVAETFLVNTQYIDLLKQLKTSLGIDEIEVVIVGRGVTQLFQAARQQLFEQGINIVEFKTNTMLMDEGKFTGEVEGAIDNTGEKSFVIDKPAFIPPGALFIGDARDGEAYEFEHFIDVAYTDDEKKSNIESWEDNFVIQKEKAKELSVASSMEVARQTFMLSILPSAVSGISLIIIQAFLAFILFGIIAPLLIGAIGARSYGKQSSKIDKIQSEIKYREKTANDYKRWEEISEGFSEKTITGLRNLLIYLAGDDEGLIEKIKNYSDEQIIQEAIIFDIEPTSNEDSDSKVAMKYNIKDGKIHANLLLVIKLEDEYSGNDVAERIVTHELRHFEFNRIKKGKGIRAWFYRHFSGYEDRIIGADILLHLKRSNPKNRVHATETVKKSKEARKFENVMKRLTREKGKLEQNVLIVMEKINEGFKRESQLVIPTTLTSEAINTFIKTVAEKVHIEGYLGHLMRRMSVL